MDAVIESYNNYCEEERLSTNNARRIEFVTTSRALKELLPKGTKVLDCGAGTGIYSFFLQNLGFDVTAVDLTPRHIDLINEKQKNNAEKIKTAVCDARNLNVFSDEEFDVVLNMGPFYHLPEKSGREKCMSECLRVLKKGGILATAYISKFYVFSYVAANNPKYLTAEFKNEILNKEALMHDDKNCFWTDSFYSSPEEMEEYYKNNNLEIIDHFAQDGISPMISEKIDALSTQKFETWCNVHYETCREKSILGSNNHILIVGRKH